MNNNMDNEAVFQFANPKQERIYRRLLLIGPGPASFYQDACRLMRQKPVLDTTTHLVSHLLREIESALRAVVKACGQPSDAPGAKGSEGGNHERQIRSILRGLDIDENEPVAKAWLDLPGQDNDYGLSARAHRESLVEPRPLDGAYRDFWEQFQQILDVVLDEFEAHYFSTHEFIDQLLKNAEPTYQNAKSVRNHVPGNPLTLNYFFKNASADWVDPLKKANFFADPPAAHNPSEETTTFYGWPASRYLARIASEVPEQVRDVILLIPETDNWRVHHDMTEAACSMPAGTAVPVAEQEIAWITEQSSLCYPLASQLGALVSRLARGEEMEVAIELASALWAVRPDPKSEKEAEHERPGSRFLQPRPLMRLTAYEEFADEHIPVLIETAPLQTLVFLCDILDKALHLSYEESDGPQDGHLSYIWRPAIETHEQNNERSARNALVSWVRDAGVAAIKHQGKEALERVESDDNAMFKRIGLHLRRMRPAVDMQGTAALLTDPEIIESICLHHEFFWLLNDCFGDLPWETQQEYFRLVQQGPELSGAGYPPPEEANTPEMKREIEDYIRHWRYRKLTPVQKYLPAEVEEHFSSLKKEFEGSAQYPDFYGIIQGIERHPAESPKSCEELGEMAPEEIVEFLKTWEPSGQFEEPSLEGMGRELSNLVASEPERLAEHAELFKGLDPVYVRELFSSLGKAVGQDKQFPWEPVLNLARWVTRQDRDIPERDVSEPLIDPDWSWTRKSIASLLSDGFKSGRASVDWSLREKCWAVLKPLTDDEEPTRAYEVEQAGSMKPSTVSLNTVRGQAMHAVMRYALWVSRHTGETEDQELSEAGFDEMPEVRRVLDRHLDVEFEPTLTIRSVYGQWFPWLNQVDTEWVSENVPAIFPRDDRHRVLRNAAWDTYISMSKPYNDIFDVLRDEYSYAVDNVGAGDRQGAFHRHPDEYLGIHLANFYWRGKIDLEEDGLLDRYFRKTSPELRGHVLDFMGRLLEQTEDEIPDEALRRLQRFWEWRLESIRSNDGDGAEELAYFGRWFISDKFDGEWSVNQLRDALELTGKIEATSWVIDRLPQLAERFSCTCMECIKLIGVSGEGVLVLGGSRMEKAREILREGLQSGDGKVREKARSVVHRLGAHGYPDLRELLEEDQPSEDA